MKGQYKPIRAPDSILALLSVATRKGSFAVQVEVWNHLAHREHHHHLYISMSTIQHGNSTDGQAMENRSHCTTCPLTVGLHDAVLGTFLSALPAPSHTPIVCVEELHHLHPLRKWTYYLVKSKFAALVGPRHNTLHISALANLKEPWPESRPA